MKEIVVMVEWSLAQGPTPGSVGKGRGGDRLRLESKDGRDSSHPTRFVYCHELCMVTGLKTTNQPQSWIKTVRIIVVTFKLAPQNSPKCIQCAFLQLLIIQNYLEFCISEFTEIRHSEMKYQKNFSGGKSPLPLHILSLGASIPPHPTPPWLQHTQLGPITLRRQ
jgi:hypothetical protein